MEEWIEAYVARQEAIEARLRRDQPNGRQVVVDMVTLGIFLAILYGVLNHGYPMPHR